MDSTFFSLKNSSATSRAEGNPFLDLSAQSEPIEFTWTIPKLTLESSEKFEFSSYGKWHSIASDPLTLDGLHFLKFEIFFGVIAVVGRRLDEQRASRK